MLVARSARPPSVCTPVLASSAACLISHSVIGGSSLRVMISGTVSRSRCCWMSISASAPAWIPAATSSTGEADSSMMESRMEGWGTFSCSSLTGEPAATTLDSTSDACPGCTPVNTFTMCYSPLKFHEEAASPAASLIKLNGPSGVVRTASLAALPMSPSTP